MCGDIISVPIPTDEHGFTGRECPNLECKGYFKIVGGTGLEDDELPCHCPYCGYTDEHDEFWTTEQIEYAASIAMRELSDAVVENFKSLEFDHKSRGPFGIGISFKVEAGPPPPIHYYREKELETTVLCSNCALQYAVYGVFAFCPDCGRHNSLQILEMNFEVIRKMLELAKSQEPEVSERLIENALEDCVSAFDGFGRELCRVYAERITNPKKANNIRFQNLDKTREKLHSLGIDLTQGLSPEAWQQAIRLFQKRHLCTHKFGVVDQEYLNRAGEKNEVVGRKIRISANEVSALSDILRAVAKNISAQFESLETEGTDLG